MDRNEVERLLRDHLRGVHEEITNHFRGVREAMEDLMRGTELALDNHLARTETALADALLAEREEIDARFAAMEMRLAALEAGS